ncbi:hypothetical protein EU538_11555 [Candidatus Thorarchaeota archaeon]|nr:MAG: hypothetical protein EU538_11555 [Candidatus Thorarchaeota archaeon]
MKRIVELLVALFLVGMFLISPVTAATSQGLEWGVDDGDQFNSQLHLETSDNQTVDEGVYMEITSTPTIPNIVTEWNDLPVLGVDLAWTNGTPMGFSALLFSLIVAGGGRIGVPTGNWTLLSELIDDWWHDSIFAPDELTVIDNYYYWGVDAYEEQGDTETSVRLLYLKEDGFLAKYEVESTQDSDTTIITAIRDGLPSDIQVLVMDNILLIGGGLAVIVILGAVVCKKR